MAISTDYGTDLSTYMDPSSGVPDLDPTFAIISGPRVVIERVARKLMTPTGSMLKAGWGFDMRSVLQSSLTPAQIGQLRGIVSDQINQEPEVESCSVSIAYTIQGKRIDITGQVTLLTGVTFPLVYVVTPETVQPIFDDIAGVQ